MTGPGAVRLTCALQALVIALGCGIAVARQTGDRPSRPAVTAAARPAPLGSNEARARQEAAWLLTLTRVPSGAQPTGRQPRNLSAPVTGTPWVSSLVTRTAYWRVRTSYAATSAWAQSHPPRGLVFSHSGQMDGPDGSTVGYGYSDRSTTSWSEAELDISVAADGDGSAIRADAIVVWLDPKPVRDATAGKRMRVTVAGGCPANDRGIVGVRNDDGRLAAQLLPDAEPSRGLLCRYGGLNGQTFALSRATHLDAAQAVSVAQGLRKLPLSHVDGSVHGCRMDDGSAAVVVLRFPGAQDVDVWVTLTGCTFVSNGYIAAAAGPLPALIRHFR